MWGEAKRVSGRSVALFLTVLSRASRHSAVAGLVCQLAAAIMPVR